MSIHSTAMSFRECFLSALFFISACLFSSSSLAVPITFSVDPLDSEQDIQEDIDLNRLLPLADNNTWSYDMLQGSGTVRQITARLGSAETIGGGCLSVQPITFSNGLSLFIGNDGESLSLYGIDLNLWKDLTDLSFRFETRNRVEWRDFANRFISEDITPLSSESCQDTGRGGFPDRGGVMLLEDLTENLGTPGNGIGEIDCSTKNSDLRDNLAGGLTGSGTAFVAGQFNSLVWESGVTLTRESNTTVRINLVFRPTVQGSRTDYTMHFNILLTEGVGITSLVLSDDGGPIDFTSRIDEFEFQYRNADSQISSTTNQVVAGGSCPSDDGRVSYFIVLILLGLVVKRRFYNS